MQLHLIVFPVLSFLRHDFWSLSGEISVNTRVSSWPRHISSSWESITANRCSFVINIFFHKPKVVLNLYLKTVWQVDIGTRNRLVWLLHTINIILQVDSWYIIILYSNKVVDILIEVLRGFFSLLTKKRIISQSRTLCPFPSISLVYLASCHHPVTSKRRS
jgi:hypothetical protein